MHLAEAEVNVGNLYVHVIGSFHVDRLTGIEVSEELAVSIFRVDHYMIFMVLTSRNSKCTILLGRKRMQLGRYCFEDTF
jgi:hypothetical protein